MRIGLGYDIHRAGKGDHIWLGGVCVSAPFCLLGHSDADVLLHAVTDAILGALADYDIGHYFPAEDEKNRGRPSADFLRFALERMQAAGYEIANIDCNLICELPRIAPVREEIRRSLASLLKIEQSKISVKGRSNEKIDAVGAGQAVICQAVVLLKERDENQ